MSLSAGDSAHSQAFAAIALIATLVSSIASIIMLWLIMAVRKWSGHLLLIATMTSFQLLYDASFYSAVVDVQNAYVSIPSNVAQILGGLSSSLVSNAIAAIAFYVITRRRSFPIFSYYPYMLSFIVAAGLCDATLFVLSVTLDQYEYLARVSVLQFYCYTRLASIVVNFCLALATAMQIRNTSSRLAHATNHERNLNNLAFRLFYYPIVQAVSRSGATWYEVKYGYVFSPSTGYNFDPDRTSNWAFAAQCTMALSMPVASIGYLITFLIMQPHAKETLWALLGRKSATDAFSEPLLSIPASSRSTRSSYYNNNLLSAHNRNYSNGVDNEDENKDCNEDEDEDEDDDEWTQSIASITSTTDL